MGSDLRTRLITLRRGAERGEPTPWMQRMWKIQNDKFIEYASENVDESHYWNWYRAKHKEDKYFKLQHIHDIGLPFEIAVVLTKRGTGKTYGYMNLIRELYEQGKQVVIVRNTQQEIKGGVREQFENPDCPFEIIRDKYIVVKGNKDMVVGYLAYLSGTSQQWQGADYPRVHTIIWDEATNGGNTTANTRTWIHNFWQLTSTFFRNKLEWKVWIFGNLLKNSEGKISDALLCALGINMDTNFKYIINKSPNDIPFRLIYVNTTNLYSGADDHLMSNITIDQQEREELMTNSPFKISECIISPHFFVMAEKQEWGIFTTFDKTDWMILITSEPNIDIENPELLKQYEQGELGNISDRFFIVKCEELKLNKIGSKNFRIFTDDVNLYNAYKRYCFYKLDLKKFWYRLWKLIKSGRTLYIGDESYRNLLRIMSGRKDSIKSFREEKFPKKNKQSKSKTKSK